MLLVDIMAFLHKTIRRVIADNYNRDNNEGTL